MTLRLAIRALVRRPAFSLLAVGALALGVAGTTAVYGLVHNVLIEGLPYPEADRLVTPDVRSPQGHVISLSIPNYRDWAGRSRVLEDHGASAGWTFVRPRPDGAEMLVTRVVLGDFFATLGLRPARGRLFGAAETERGQPPVAVLGHGFWQRELGGRDVLGEPLVTDAFTATIVGILPPGVGYPDPTVEAYVPMGVLGDGIAWDNRWSSSGTRMIARLAPGVSFGEARSDLSRIADEVAEEEGRAVATPELRSLEDFFLGDVRRGLWLLLGAVGLLLLIACANVANLALARGEGRARELAVRAALGAGRRRLTALLLTESAVLAVVSGVLGVALAAAAIRGLPRVLPLDLPGLVAGRVALNGPVLVFALGVTTVSGLLFGLVPALRIAVAGRGPSMTSLRQGAGQSAHRDARRLRDGLVVVQVALSLVLLVTAGLLTRSLVRLGDVDKGFVAESVVTARLQPPEGLWPDVEQRWDFYDALGSRLAASPQVETAAATLLIPLSGNAWERLITPEGGPLEPTEMASVLYNAVGDDYFRALGIPILRGRGFTPADDAGAEPVAVIDRTMAEAFWPGENPIGKRVTFNDGDEGEPIEWRTVVGVVPNTRHYELEAPSRIQVYLPMRQVPYPIDYAVAMKVTPGAEAAGIDLVRRTVAELAPGTALRELRPLSSYVADRLGPTRALGTLTAVFATFAVLLAALGIFGVLSLAVARRRREIGVRMAVGATAGSVLGLVVRHGLAVAGIGAAIGLAGSLAASGAVASLLYEVRPLDPLVYGLGVAGILALAGASALFPALRAARTEPARVLREE